MKKLIRKIELRTRGRGTGNGGDDTLSSTGGYTLMDSSIKLRNGAICAVLFWRSDAANGAEERKVA